MHHLIADPAGSAWSFGGSILTMAFPMILFIVVAITLYVLYTKPEFVPGHWVRGAERPVSYTALPGRPAIDHEIPAAPADAAGPTRAEMAGPTSAEATGTAGTTETPSDERAGSEGGE
ncbi:MAG: hypothetical protein ACRDN0_34220 [Trebonia sp.]